jgi:POT family proton-dependent oligopeptide transporter
MSRTKYRTAPDPNETGMPSGVPYIVGNEAAERFSFYGMRAILYVFMTDHLIGMDGQLATMDPTEATIWQHNFMKVAYAFPLLGAVLCDWLFGKYRTILWLSILYCVGHAMMALVDLPALTGISPRTSLWVALALIALGTGGIKPCVSAHVGDQFGAGNQSLMSRVYMWFYFSINFGAMLSTILTPRLLEHYGPGIAFGVPGVLMAIATIIFWLGRKKFVHVPPGGKQFFRDTFSPEGLRAVANLIPLYLLLAVFWCLFDQTTSTWVEQAKHMDRVIFGIEINPSENQATNPLLVMLLIPLFSHVLYPAINSFWTLTPLRKIGIGMFIAPVSFLIPAWVQSQIDASLNPHISWQMLAYLVLTAAEVMITITAIEFSYSQAPARMKSFISGVFWFSVYLGNEMTVQVNKYVQQQAASGIKVLEGANYFLFFAGAMLLTALLYVIWSQTYHGDTYIQGEKRTEVAE